MQSSETHNRWQEGLLGHGQALGDCSEGWHRLVAQIWISPECLCNPLLSPRVFQGVWRLFLSKVRRGDVFRFYIRIEAAVVLELHSLLQTVEQLLAFPLRLKTRALSEHPRRAAGAGSWSILQYRDALAIRVQI